MIVFTKRENLDILRLQDLGNFNFRENLQFLFNFMKQAETQHELYSRSIEFESSDFDNFRLVPVAKVNANSPSVISSLFSWRLQNEKFFPNSNPITISSTQSWIQNSLLLNTDRILFLVVNEFGQEVAHLGFWLRENNVFELDNVIKGNSELPKGLMSNSVKTLGLWANEFLNLKILKLRVLQSNSHASKFYGDLGFEIETLTKLKWVISGNKRELVECSPGEKSDDSWCLMSISPDVWAGNPSHILTAGPSIGPLEVSLVSDAVKTGWNDFHSHYLNKFTEDFSAYIGAKYSIPTDSCTSALHMSLWSLGIGPGDEVIIPETTWVATANAVKYVGATPIFADVDKETWCISADSIESLLTKNTKAVIPVHLYGYVGNLTRVSEICRNNNLYLVQDAAPAIGSLFNDKSTASYGDISCFSFQGAKLLVSGEGGVLTTNNKDIYERAFKIGDSGRMPGTFWIDTYGKKMKMTNITAALAVAQLHSAERQIAQKRQISAWYKELLGGIDGLSFQLESANTRSICWMTSILIDRKGFDREDFRAKLLDMKIDTRPVFPAISQYPIWDLSNNPQPVAKWIGENALNLPSGVRLTKNSVERVCEAIKSLL